jgi:hypothetical protein
VSEHPIYPKTYDLLAYLVQVTESFPRSQRFVLARRIQDAALDFYDLLIVARKVNVQERRDVLRRADAKLEMLRTCTRLAMELGFLPFGQYEHASGMVVEVGKMLGRWRQKLEQCGAQGGHPRGDGP